MVNVLLDAGADVDVKNNEQLTALQLAVASKHASAVEITQALMAKQPDITVVNRDGESTPCNSSYTPQSLNNFVENILNKKCWSLHQKF